MTTDAGRSRNHLLQSQRVSPLRVALRRLAATVVACFITGALANPTAPTVVNGVVSFNQAGNLLTVTNSNGAVIHWNTFSIASGETTRFIQPSAASSVLNRVLGGDPSAIYGTLSSNGRVWLVNPAGILVGPGGRVDVAGFVASTLNVSTADFLANRLTFNATPGAGNVVNQGEILTPAGGSVYLVGTNVSNEGLITTPQGETILAAGQTVSLLDTATPGVKVDITGAAGNATNLGQIVADAGRIGIAGVIVRNGGTLNASSAVSEGGKIFLRASRDVTLEGGSQLLARGAQGGGHIEVFGGMTDGAAKIDGVLDASATADGDGGFVETSAAHVTIADSTHVSTRGAGATGRTGLWLIDPNDFTIAAIGGDMSGAAVAEALGSSDLTIETATMGSPGNGDIFVNDAIASASINKLSLVAERHITLSANVATAGDIELTAGGNITQNTGYTLSNGAIAGTHDITMTGVDITLRSVVSQRHVILNPSGTLNLLGLGSGGFIDDTYFTYNLPFTFNFYGQNYTQAYITTNGLITFGNSTSAYSDSLDGLGSYRAIAPAWNDWTLEASTGRDIRIGLGGGNLTVLWDVGRFPSTVPAARFEAVLNPSGAIRFDYGAATTLGSDVTIGLSDGTGNPLASQLMSLPNFATNSINNLRSTTFTPNGYGGYTETLSAGNIALANPGPVSGSALLGQGTGTVITAQGDLVIDAGGSINAISALSAHMLRFTSHGGAIFTGANTFDAIGASHNDGDGDVTIYNTGSPLTLHNLANNGGNLIVDNVGGIVVAGAVSASNDLTLQAHSPITINSGASVTAGGNLTLTAFSSSVTSLTDLITIAGLVSSTGGNIALIGGSGITFAATANVSAPMGSLVATSPYGPVTVAPGAFLFAVDGITLTSFAANSPTTVTPSPSLDNSQVVTVFDSNFNRASDALPGESDEDRQRRLQQTAASGENHRQQSHKPAAQCI